MPATRSLGISASGSIVSGIVGVGGTVMWWHVACDALSAGKRLVINYGGHTRVVEVHAVGTSTAGNPVMRAWQVTSTKPGGNNEWRTFRLDKTWRFALSNEKSEAPRAGYRRNDADIPFIRCQI